METRTLRVSFNKSGAGNITPKLALPALWIKEMGLNIENRNVEVVFENNQITIKSNQSV